MFRGILSSVNTGQLLCPLTHFLEYDAVWFGEFVLTSCLHLQCREGFILQPWTIKIVANDTIIVKKVHSTFSMPYRPRQRVDLWVYSFFNLGTVWGGWSTPHPVALPEGMTRCLVYRRLGPVCGKTCFHGVSIPGPSMQ